MLKVDRDLVPAYFSSVRRSWLISDVRLLLERDGEALGVHAAQMRQAADLLRHHTASKVNKWTAGRHADAERAGRDKQM